MAAVFFRTALWRAAAVTDDSSSQQIPPFEYRKWLYDMKREDAHRAHDRLAEFYNSINEQSIKSAELTLRTCILINGGAAAITSIVASHSTREPRLMSDAPARPHPTSRTLLGRSVPVRSQAALCRKKPPRRGGLRGGGQPAPVYGEAMAATLSKSFPCGAH
jgi:hypothetical protein